MTDVRAGLKSCPWDEDVLCAVVRNMKEQELLISVRMWINRTVLIYIMWISKFFFSFFEYIVI